MVALSFGKETANGIVVNINGNFNISSINETNNTVFFQDNNTVYENTFSCGVVSSFITNETSANEKGDRWDGTINISDFKCLRIYFELRYDMFERFAQISTTDVGDRVVGYFSSVFNQVAAIYYNAGIMARISELKINTGSDLYPLYQGTSVNNNSLSIFNSFKNNLTNNYDGDVAQLVSAKVTTSWANGLLKIGSSNSNKRICEVQKRDLCSYAGIGIENDYGNNNHFFNYSWNINVIVHELGHVLGANHTRSCVWNGNNTGIDNCGPHYFSTNLNTLGDDGVNCYNSSAPILPAIGGTIMSYCHLLNNIGIKFSNGFGSQPGNRIRSKICRKGCLTPLSCYRDLYIGYSDNKSATNDYNVPNGHTDIRQVSNDLYVYNTVEVGGKARYTAGNSIRLLPNTVPNYLFDSTTPSYATGFYAKQGSDVVLKIAYCPTFEYSISGLQHENVSQSASNTTFFEQEFVTLYPNPTTGIVTIESNYEIIFWELTDQTGVIYQSNKVDNLKKIDLDFLHLNAGVYNIKIHLSNGNFSYKKIIKQ